jgi:uncharacterized protein (TIGR02147 family)
MSFQYQDFLLEEFRSRRSRNPHYSLRAFARDIGMPASKLSQNLRGLCGISVNKAESIASKLHMAENERKLFLAMVESQHARSRVARQQALVALKAIREEHISELSLEKFSTIRDWYHLAILELATTRGFRADTQWIADRLGLPHDLIAEAVQRLQNVGLLTDLASGLKKVEKGVEWSQGIPSRTIREHHKQVLAKATQALDLYEGDKREYSSHFFSVDPKKIPELKKYMREVFIRLNQMANDGDKDAVYVCSMQLFPVVDADE